MAHLEIMYQAIVVLPTYNECENIGRLLPMIFAVADRIKDWVKISVLVVDDGSPDNTAGVVRRLQFLFPDLHLISGKKQGLGKAYIRGIGYALNVLNADIVLEMDADLSHDPSVIPWMLREITDNKTDFVIGSRYVAGGSIPENWPRIRKCISRLGNMVARFVIGLYKVKDCTSGFRAIRATTLKAMDLGNIPSSGYVFQVSLLQRAGLVGARILEIPIIFRDRIFGISKLRVEDIIEFLFRSVILRTHALLIRFGIPGLLGLLAVVLTLLTYISPLPFLVSVVLGVSIFLSIQGLWNIRLLLHAWEDPSRVGNLSGNDEHDKPRYSFTALIPARHEEAVIAETIISVSSIRGLLPNSLPALGIS